MAPDPRGDKGPVDSSENGGFNGRRTCPICGDPISPRWLGDVVAEKHAEGPRYDS